MMPFVPEDLIRIHGTMDVLLKKCIVALGIILIPR
jgi:hypothetical protein